MTAVLERIWRAWQWLMRKTVLRRPRRQTLRRSPDPAADEAVSIGCLVLAFVVGWIVVFVWILR